MITVLIHYKEWINSGHPLIAGAWVENSKVVEVVKLTDLNDIFRHIVKIDIIH